MKLPWKAEDSQHASCLGLTLTVYVMKSEYIRVYMSAPGFVWTFSGFRALFSSIGIMRRERLAHRRPHTGVAHYERGGKYHTITLKGLHQHRPEIKLALNRWFTKTGQLRMVQDHQLRLLWEEIEKKKSQVIPEWTRSFISGMMLSILKSQTRFQACTGSVNQIYSQDIWIFHALHSLSRRTSDVKLSWGVCTLLKIRELMKLVSQASHIHTVKSSFIRILTW